MNIWRWSSSEGTRQRPVSVVPTQRSKDASALSGASDALASNPQGAANMHESVLKPGDAVTVRRGALLLPDGRRRLPADCQAKVIAVTGRSVKVEASTGFADDENGFRLVGRFLTFDASYVYRRDA